MNITLPRAVVQAALDALQCICSAEFQREAAEALESALAQPQAKRDSYVGPYADFGKRIRIPNPSEDEAQPQAEPAKPPMFANAVSRRKWEELQAHGYQMQYLAFARGDETGQITAYGNVSWGDPAAFGCEAQPQSAQPIPVHLRTTFYGGIEGSHDGEHWFSWMPPALGEAKPATQQTPRNEVREHQPHAECDSPEICRVAGRCAGQYDTKKICGGEAQPAPAGEPVAIVEVAVPHLRSIIVNHIQGAPFPKVGDFFYTTPQPRKSLRPQSPCEMTVAENRMFRLGWLECEAAHGIGGQA